MTAGDLSYILGYVYASDDAVPIAAGDPIYYPGLPFGKVEFEHPAKAANISSWWCANSANPAGAQVKKVAVEGVIGMTVLPIDGNPFYLALGGTPAYADSTYTMSGSVSGAVPSTIWHKENNELANEQAKEYYDCKCAQLDLKLVEGLIATKLTFVAEREYNMTSDSIVRQTGTPKLRGSVNTGTYYAPAEMIDYGKLPYPVYDNTKGHTITWGGKTLPYLQDVKFSIKNKQVARQYSAVDWATIQNKGKREYSELTMVFAVKPGATNDLDDMEALIGTKSDNVWTVSRRHANDYLKLTFQDAYLKSWLPTPTPMGQDYDSLITGVWAGITDLQVIDKSVLANGSADPVANADYEAVV